MSNKNQDWIYEMLTITTLVISPHTGRALCEAALAGSLIVAYDIDWQKEIIIQNKTGMLAEYKNVKQLFDFSKKIVLNKTEQIEPEIQKENEDENLVLNLTEQSEFEIQKNDIFKIKFF